MDSLLLPILIASVVILLVWGIAVIARGGAVKEKKKLQQRLSTEGKGTSSKEKELPLSITLQIEAGGLSALLVKFSPLQALYRRLVQAWPEMTVARFLTISGG